MIPDSQAKVGNPLGRPPQIPCHVEGNAFAQGHLTEILARTNSGHSLEDPYLRDPAKVTVVAKGAKRIFFDGFFDG